VIHHGFHLLGIVRDNFTPRFYIFCGFTTPEDVGGFDLGVPVMVEYSAHKASNSELALVRIGEFQGGLQDYSAAIKLLACSFNPSNNEVPRLSIASNAASAFCSGVGGGT